MISQIDQKQPPKPLNKRGKQDDIRQLLDHLSDQMNRPFSCKLTQQYISQRKGWKWIALNFDKLQNRWSQRRFKSEAAGLVVEGPDSAADWNAHAKATAHAASQMSGEELAEFKVAVGKKIWAKAERVMKKPPDAVSVVSMPSSTLVNSNEESKVPVDLTSSDSDDTLSVLGPNTFEKICTTPDYVAGLPAATLVEFTRAAIARCSAILTEYDFDSQIRSAMPEANSRSFYISGVEFNYSLSDGFNAHDAINRLSQSDAM